MISSALKRVAPYAPVAQPSTTLARPTVRLATRKEWPEVVGSRDSIAVTEACTNPSKSRRMDSKSWLLWIATAACKASDPASCSWRGAEGRAHPPHSFPHPQPGPQFRLHV